MATRCDGDEVVITISDTGVGIPADHLPRVFDPFFTTKQVGARHRPGPCARALDRVRSPRRDADARQRGRPRHHASRSVSSIADADGRQRAVTSLLPRMTVQTAPASSTLTRRAPRAGGQAVAAALRGGLWGADRRDGGVARGRRASPEPRSSCSWSRRSAVAAVVVGWRGGVNTWVWLGLAIAWAAVLLERGGRAGERRRLGRHRHVARRDRRRAPRRRHDALDGAAARLSAHLGRDRPARRRGPARPVGRLMAVGGRGDRPRARRADSAQGAGGGAATADSP